MCFSGFIGVAVVPREVQLLKAAAMYLSDKVHNSKYNKPLVN